MHFGYVPNEPDEMIVSILSRRHGAAILPTVVQIDVVITKREMLFGFLSALYRRQ